MSSRLSFSCFLTALFLLGTGFLAWHHELWRDEMQAWLISRDSANWRAIFRLGRYEGTPPLWHLLLRPIALLTHRVEVVQALNVLLGGATFFLICHVSPFNRLQKTLLLCNYYLFFEYTIVCRQYLLGVFFLVVAVILFPSASKSPWGFAGALIGAALTSVYSLIVAAALAAAFWGSTLSATSPSGVPRPPRHILVAAGLLLTLGFGVAVFSMLPAPDALYPPANGWFLRWNSERLLRVGLAFANVHFLVPRPEGYFWIPAWLTDFSLGHALTAALAPLLFIGGVLSVRRARPALLLYLVGSLGLALFLYVKYLGYTRHAGFLFLTLLFACWLKKSRVGTDARSMAAERWAGAVLTGMLAVQAVSGIWAARLEVTRPFSAGKSAAREIAARGLDQAFIAAWPDSAGATLAGYLDRSIYYPQSGRQGSFTLWDLQRDIRMTDTEALRRAQSAAGRMPLVVVVDHALSEQVLREHGLEPLGAFQGSLVPFEDCYVYRVSAPRRPTVKLDQPSELPARRSSRQTS